MLLAAAGALLSGCGPRTASPGAPGGFPIIVMGINGSQARSFALAAPGAVAPVPRTSQPAAGGGAGPQWEIAPVLPFLGAAPQGFAPVDPALRAANFRSRVLLAGTQEAFAAADGSHYGVPAYVGAWAVQYDPRVYAEVGLTEPPPDWTIDDFEHDCAVVAAAIAGGKLAHLLAVLPPLVGTQTEKAQPATMSVSGQFKHPALWGAFIAGFGGTVAGGGGFDLTNAGAVAGLQRMVDIATRYGASGPAPVAPRFDGSSVWHPVTKTGWGKIGAQGGVMPYAMIFAPTAQLRGMYATPVVGQGWRWARLPGFPVQSVVPLQVTGFTVSPSAAGWWAAAGAPPQSPPEALTALADFAAWWYQQYDTNPGLIGLPAPVLGDATVQDAYWNAPGQPGGYPAVGDWHNFAVVEAGWPVVPGASSASPSPVFDALTQAVARRMPISPLLPQVSQQLNAMVATADTHPAGRSG